MCHLQPDRVLKLWPGLIMINKWVIVENLAQAWTCWLYLFVFLWWPKHHQTIGFRPIGNHKTYSLVWYLLSRANLFLLGNLDCMFDSNSTLLVHLPLFACVSSATSVSSWGLCVDWSPPLTPDLLIPCQLQWGLQGGLCECVCVWMHVWMSVCV